MPPAGEVLKIPGVSADVMDLLIDWLYSDFKESITFKQRQALFEVSHKFDILELHQECKRVFSSSVTCDTYAILTSMADRLECHCLKQVRLSRVQCMIAITHVQPRGCVVYSIRPVKCSVICIHWLLHTLFVSSAVCTEKSESVTRNCDSILPITCNATRNCCLMVQAQVSFVCSCTWCCIKQS